MKNSCGKITVKKFKLESEKIGCRDVIFVGELGGKG